MQQLQQILDNVLQQINSFKFGLINVVEILVMAFILYHIFLWIKNTRTWFVFRGILFVVLFVLAANLLNLTVVTFIAEKTASILAIALLIIFQPELRASLERLGQKNYLMDIIEGSNSQKRATIHAQKVADELVEAAFALAKTRTGALIVIEREIPLEEYIKTGIRLDAMVSSALLINIFEHNTPLHDGAVVIKKDRIASATCYLPLSSNPEIKKTLGTRHRAAIGVSEVTDSVTIVVSEETGRVSLAKGGVLLESLTRGELRRELAALERIDREEKEKKKTKQKKTPEKPEEEAIPSPAPDRTEEARTKESRTAILYEPQQAAVRSGRAEKRTDGLEEKRERKNRVKPEDTVVAPILQPAEPVLPEEVPPGKDEKAPAETAPAEVIREESIPAETDAAEVPAETPTEAPAEAPFAEAGEEVGEEELSGTDEAEKTRPGRRGKSRRKGGKNK